MAAPTVYRWDDPSAPLLNENSGSYQALFRACLIDGYGSKLPPVSGANKWSIPFSDATSFILKQGGTNPRKLCMKMFDFFVIDRTARIEIAENYSSINSPVVQLPTPLLRSPVGFAGTAGTVPWIIFATERMIYAHFGIGGSASIDRFTTSTIFSDSDSHSTVFGDYKTYFTHTDNQCVFWRDTTSTSGMEQSITYPDSTNSRKINFHTNHSMELMSLGVLGSNAILDNDNTSTVIPKYVTGDIVMTPTPIVSNQLILGEMPGLLFSPQTNITTIYGDIQTMVGVGDFVGNTIYHIPSGDRFFMIHDGDWGVE